MARLGRKWRIFLWVWLLVLGAWGYYLSQSSNSSDGSSEQPSSQDTLIDQVNTANERQSFFVDTQTLDELQSWVSIKKTWTITWQQDITVSSQVSGRVSSIRFDQWTRVSNGATVVRLADSTSQLTFNAQRAQQSLDQARANYNQTVVSLDKAIIDTELAVRQAQNQSNNAALWSSSSWASLQVQQLNTQLDKAQIDLDNVKQSNDDQLESFEQSVENLFRTIELLYDSVIEPTDTLLWVSTLRERENDEYEKYLWVRNTTTKFQAQQALRELFIKQQQFNALPSDVGPWTLESTLETLEWFVEDLKPVLDAVDVMLSFTAPWNQLQQWQIDGFNQQNNALRQQVQSQLIAINSQKRSIESFLNTYERNEASIEESIQSLRDQIAATTKNLESAEVQTDLSVENAENTFATALKNKDTTLASLQNSIDSAQIAVREAQTQLWKLTVESPIAGTIGEVLVDEWQEVWPWTPLFTIVSESDQTVIITLTQAEVDRVDEWQDVTVTIWSNSYDGEITSIAATTWRTLGYDAEIRLKQNVPLLGSVATVDLPLSSELPLIPLQSVAVLNPTQWILSLYDNGELEELTVELGAIRWQRVELRTELPSNARIITSSVKNYNANEFILTEND